MRGIKEFIIGCAVALLSTCGLMSALADDEEAAFNAGLAAMQRGHYAMAYRAWIDIAQSGNARAKSNIGYLYEQGVWGQSRLRQGYDLVLWCGRRWSGGSTA